jgi:hypothetical protein
VVIPGTERTVHGIEGARASEAEIAETFVDHVWQPERIEQLDDGRWLCLVSLSGRGTRSGVPTEAQMVHIARYDQQDRLKRLDTHVSWDQARRATAAKQPR